MKIVDANILLRYLLQDHTELAEKAVEIIEKNEIFIPFEVAAEIVYVLQKIYKVNRERISSSLQELFFYKNIYTNDQGVLLRALEIFASTTMDFVDTLLCGYALINGDDVFTFDNKIKKFIEQKSSNIK